MTVVQGITYKAYPGKQNAMIERMQESKAIAGRHGVDVRILMNVAGGSNSVMFAASFADMVDFGQKAQELGQDPEWQQLQAAIAESPNAEMLSSALWTDIG